MALGSERSENRSNSSRGVPVERFVRIIEFAALNIKAFSRAATVDPKHNIVYWSRLAAIVLYDRIG